ncbi:MAG TPA: ATP-binding protein [Fibrobacteria bacterium]|nr:ATP-binding protein [Fibrobacteria bacterium]
MFPFSAVVGQEKAQKALCLNLISPGIGGALLMGSKGTAKSTLVRSLARLLPEARIFNVPVGITEDHLLGGLDWHAAIKTGRTVFSPGLLAEAHGHILYLDEVNLLDERLVHAVLDAAECGEVRFERDGLSLGYPCFFSLVASMNPEEGDLSPHLLDRFGLCVDMGAVEDPAQRTEILRRRLPFEKDPMLFLQEWRKKENSLAIRIRESQARMSQVRFPAELLGVAVGLSSAKGCAGHRGEIALCRAAKALAAWYGRSGVTERHIREIAAFALDHRASDLPKDAPPEAPAVSKSDSDPGSEGLKGAKRSRADATDPLERDVAAASKQDSVVSSRTPGEEIQFGISEGYSAPETANSPFDREKSGAKSGRRHRTRSVLGRGRASGHRRPVGKPRSISWDATLKQALPRQAGRRKGNLCVSIRCEDIRENRRKGKTGRILLFLVDASGSMGAHRRMAAAKGCILAALKDAYLRRDRVALMVFRRRETRLLLPLAKSPDLAERLLREIPTGGETPLALGIGNALDFCRKIKARESATPIHVLLFSDGRANVSTTGRNPIEETLDICKTAAKENLSFTVVDTETGFVRLEMALKIADHLKASYRRLEDLRENNTNSRIIPPK